MQEIESGMGGPETGSLDVEWLTVPASWCAQVPAALAAGLPAQPAAAADAAADAAEPLPEFSPAPPPKVRSIGPFPRADMVPQLGRSPDLVRAVFTELESGQLADRVYEVEGSFVIVQLTVRQEPDLERFAAEEDTLRRRYTEEKSYEVLRAWTQDRCRALVERRAIGFNKEVFDLRDDRDRPLPVTYQPCSMF
jgi:hypothetical protein